MNYEARVLRAFAVTARRGSVSRAAETLGVRQPTVSAQLRKLEGALGFSLLRRTTRHVELTREGRRLLPLVETLLDDADRLRQGVEEIRGAARKVLRLGSALYLQQVPERLAVLEAFAAARPDLGLEVDSHLQANHVEALLAGALDIAFLVGYPITRRQAGGWTGGELEIPAGLPRLVLGRRRLNLLMPAASDLASFATVPARLLAGRTVMMLGPDHGRDLVATATTFLEARGARVVTPAVFWRRRNRGSGQP
jgi:DNA-binding transcriptional LysR family regulator